MLESRLIAKTEACLLSLLLAQNSRSEPRKVVSPHSCVRRLRFKTGLTNRGQGTPHPPPHPNKKESMISLEKKPKHSHHCIVCVAIFQKGCYAFLGGFLKRTINEELSIARPRLSPQTRPQLRTHTHTYTLSIRAKTEPSTLPREASNFGTFTAWAGW